MALAKFTVEGKQIVPIKSSTYKDEITDIDTTVISFDDFKIRYNNKWFVTLYPPETKWAEALCSCPTFQKKYICKHVLGIAVRMSEFIIPNDAKSIPIGTKRKRERPAKAKKKEKKKN